MLERRTLQVALGLAALYALLFLPGLIWAGYSESPFGVVMLLPYLTAVALHAAGVPGVLEHDGLCGWGWCAPTTTGLVMVVVLWIGATWLLSFALARLWRRFRR